MRVMQTMLRDRRVWLIAALGVAAFVIGRSFVTPQVALTIVAKAGYWLLFITFGFFCRAIWRAFRPEGSACRPGRKEFFALFVVLICVAVWTVHERRGFKILADEVLLLGTSMVMHEEREVSYPARATDVRGPFELTHQVVDKRPYFFPFLVSLVHDLTGYRVANAFCLNAILGGLFLILVYAGGRNIAGDHWAGIFSVLLFAGLPLLAQQAAGGGFELLNLVMLSVVFACGFCYAENPSEDKVEALCLAAVLLAYTRYESIIMIFAVAVLVVWGWWRADRVILTWPVMLTPVALFPYVLQNRIFEANSAAWELASKPEAGAPFGLRYVPDNLGHALGFFFDTSGYQPNSIFFAAIGLTALPFFALIVVRYLRAGRDAKPGEFTLAILALGLFAIAGLLMAYFWGQFDHPVIRRLSLPVHLLLAIAVLAVGARGIRSSTVWQWASGAALLAVVLQAIPSMSRQAYAWEYTPGIEMAWREEFLRQHPERDYLFIDQDSVFWIIQRVVATPIQQARERKEGLAYHLRNRSFSAMYVFQRFTVDENTGQLTVEPGDDIGPDFELETVVQRRVATLHLARISRVVAVRENGKLTARAGFAPLAEGPARTPEELEKAKARYLEKWIKQLP